MGKAYGIYIPLKQLNQGHLMFDTNHKTTLKLKLRSLFISRPITIRDKFNCEFDKSINFVLKKFWKTVTQVEFIAL